jgi:hypothetical protein
VSRPGGVLQAAGVVKLLPEHKRVGVLPPALLLAPDKVRLVQKPRPVRDGPPVVLQNSRLGLPLSPELQLVLAQLAGIDAAARRLKELAAMQVSVPTLQVAFVGRVLPAWMDELDEATPIPHR